MKDSSILSFNYLVRFTVKLILIVLSCIFILQLHFPSDFEKYRRKLEVYYEQRNSYKGLVVGTSHSIGFHFKSLGLKGIHFFESSSDIEETVFKANVILDDAESIDTVFIPMSPGILSISQKATDSEYIYRHEALLRNTPETNKRIVFELDGVLNDRVQYITRVREVQAAFYSFIKTRSTGKNVKNERKLGSCFTLISNDNVAEDGLVDGYRKHLIRPSCIKKYAKNTVFNHIKTINDSKAKSHSLAGENLQRLISLGSNLGSRSGKLILVIPPMTEEYYESEEIQKILPQHLNYLRVASQHPNIEVYDFHDFFYERMRDGSNNYFFDDDHLALTGAIAFSKALKHAIDDPSYGSRYTLSSSNIPDMTKNQRD